MLQHKRKDQNHMRWSCFCSLWCVSRICVGFSPVCNMHIDFHTGSISTTVSWSWGWSVSEWEEGRCVGFVWRQQGSWQWLWLLQGVWVWESKWFMGSPDRVVSVLLLLVCWWWIIYDRFLLPSRFLKLDGLIFISANSIECSWPFQWNQFTPWREGDGQMMLVRIEAEVVKWRSLAMFLSWIHITA